MSPEEEKIFYHAVALGEGGNYAAILRAKKKFLTWKETYEASGHCHIPDPEKEYRKIDERHIHLILREDSEFPSLLREIPHPPFALYIRGALPPRNQMTIAIVGTRRATPDGKDTARNFAAKLARAGIAVVSGLAFGVDAAAHEGCLDAKGTTIAVLACGLANVYRKNNASLAEKILVQGDAIISEYPPDMPAYPSRFLERNRIVSGLSKGILVVEAPERSGSLATARFALEQNRDVFVVPGPISHPNFRGSHTLIRQGATLVTRPEDILEEYDVAPQDTISKIIDTASPEEKLVLDILQETGAPADIDKIICATRLEPRIVNQTVSALFIKGVIKESGEGYVLN
jgi:DNA processing protein